MAIEQIVPKKIFFIKHSNLSRRIDPLFYAWGLDKFLKNHPIVALGDVCKKFRSGFGAGKTDQTDATDGILHLRPTNLDENGFLKFEKNIYVPPNNAYSFLDKNTVLFNNTNSQELVGKTGLWTNSEKAYCSNHITAISVDSSHILPAYLWLVLNLYQQNKVFFSICTNWNNQSGVGLDGLKALKIPLPHLTIQEKITIYFFNEYKHLMDKKAEAQQLLDSIDGYLLSELGISLPAQNNSLESRCFYSMASDLYGCRWNPSYIQKNRILSSLNSTYPSVNLSELLLATPQYGANEEAIAGTPYNEPRYIRITDINERGYLRNESWKTAAHIENKFVLNYNDLLFARSGATAGKCYIHKDTAEVAIFAGYLIRFIIDSNKALPDYVFNFCNTRLYSFWVETIQRPSGQPNINAEEYKSLMLPLPPLEKQQQLVSHISELRQQASKLEYEAAQILYNARQQVEQMIIGE